MTSRTFRQRTCWLRFRSSSSTIPAGRIGSRLLRFASGSGRRELHGAIAVEAIIATLSPTRSSSGPSLLAGRSISCFLIGLIQYSTFKATEYASHSARTRTVFCLLASLDPRYLEDGEPIPLDNKVVSYADRKHRHHLFPQAQLKKYFPARVYNSLCNICFLVARDNQKIGMRLPRHYLADYREADRQLFRRVMRSHLIPITDDSGVWERGVVTAFRQFRQQRLALICAELEKAAGIRLFRKKLRPPAFSSGN